MNYWKEIGRRCLPAVLIFLVGCRIVEKEIPDGKQIEILSVDEGKIPKKMAKSIEKMEKSPFEITFLEGEWLYIGQGYGKQEKKGYAIRMDGCLEGEYGIWVETTLLGPGSPEIETDGEEQKNVSIREGGLSKYPYAVWKIERNEKPVIFK